LSLFKLLKQLAYLPLHVFYTPADFAGFHKRDVFIDKIQSGFQVSQQVDQVLPYLL